MDTIALLCTMHADGPATLRILRRAGLHTITDIALARPERVADVLGVSPAFARRFAREAKALSERVGSAPGDPPGPFDVEGDSGSEIDDGVATVGAPSAARTDATEWGPNARSAVSDAVFRGPPPSSSAPRAIEDDALAADLRARILPESGQRLQPGLIPDLDLALCESLIAQGIRTLEALADAPGLELARRLGIPYSRWLDLQCLARHHSQAGTRGAAHQREHDLEHDRIPPRRSAPREERDPESLYTLYPVSAPEPSEREHAVDSRGREYAPDSQPREHSPDSHGRGYAPGPARSDVWRSDTRAIDVGGPFVGS